MKIPLLKNTLTNYLSMGVRLIQGVLITRWMISELGEADYGLWMMLWAFFCYSLLLDFGLGVAAQKATATELWKRDIQKYNITVSTVFLFHLAMSFVIIAGTLIASCFIRELLNLPPGADTGYYRLCFLLFGIGSATIFPFGVFPEILVGLQKIYLRNNITVLAKILELAGVGILLVFNRGLIALIIFTLALTALTQSFMMIAVLRSIPGFRILLRWDGKIFRGICSFSGTVYLTSIAKIVWERCSVLFISIFCGLVPVSVYLIGVRLTVLMTQFTGPYQENISPLSALLHSRGKREHLGRILVNSMRWNSFLATGMTIGILIYSPVLIRFLFRYTDNLEQASLICRITVVSVWFWLVFRAIPEKYLLMAERHKLLAAAALTECTLFAGSSILLLQLHPSELTVMWTSIGARLVSTCVFILPGLLRNTGLRPAPILMQAVRRPLLAALPMTALGMTEYLLLKDRVGDFLLLLLAGLTCGPLYLVFSWFLTLDPRERGKIPYLSAIIRKVHL